MVRIAGAGSPSVGVIDPVVAAFREAGVLLEVEVRDVRGDPANVWLDGMVDRDAVEEQFDLGPLLQWWPSEFGWQLVDTTTLTRTQARRSTERMVRPAPSPGGGRVRAGHLDQDDRLRASPWVAPDPVVELGAVRDARDSEVASGSVAAPWDYWAYVSLEDAPTTLARVEEVLAAVLPPLADGRPPGEVVDRLPGWFHDRCAAPYVPGTWPQLAGAPVPGSNLDAEEAAANAARIARWSTYWTAENWLRAMTPAERTWSWSSYDEVAPGLALLRYRRRALGAPVGSLKWLLHLAGATRCTLPPWPIDQQGRRVEQVVQAAPGAPAAVSPAPSPAAPPTHGQGGSWSRLVRRLRGER